MERSLEAIKARCEVTADGCWIWQGATQNGSPIAKTDFPERKFVKVRREAYRISTGDEAKSTNVKATCGKMLCVCPEHAYTTKGYYSVEARAQRAKKRKAQQAEYERRVEVKQVTVKACDAPKVARLAFSMSAFNPLAVLR